MAPNIIVFFEFSKFKKIVTENNNSCYTAELLNLAINLDLDLSL